MILYIYFVLAFVNNLAEGIYNSKCKTFKIYLKFVNVKDKLLILGCLNCNKNHKKLNQKTLKL